MEDVTAEAMEDGADEFTYLLEVAGFTKTIESEVSAKEAETHLLDLRDEHEEWKEFSERDVKLLARIFGVLKFENKESIMKQGEGATFFGILLSGSALITVNLPDKKKLNFPLTKGGVLGEMAYFEGGARSADVNASGAQPTLFAVMTYDDLEKLHEVSGQLQSKLVVMFATKSLEKQRKNLTSASDKKKAEKVSRRRNTGVMESALKRRSMMPKKRNPASNSSLTEDKQAKELRRLQAQMANMKLEQDRIAAEKKELETSKSQKINDVATLQKKVTQLTGLLIDANAASLRQKQKANSFENQFLQNQKMTIQAQADVQVMRSRYEKLVAKMINKSSSSDTSSLLTGNANVRDINASLAEHREYMERKIEGMQVDYQHLESRRIKAMARVKKLESLKYCRRWKQRKLMQDLLAELYGVLGQVYDFSVSFRGKQVADAEGGEQTLTDVKNEIQLAKKASLRQVPKLAGTVRRVVRSLRYDASKLLKAAHSNSQLIFSRNLELSAAFDGESVVRNKQISDLEAKVAKGSEALGESEKRNQKLTEQNCKLSSLIQKTRQKEVRLKLGEQKRHQAQMYRDMRRAEELALARTTRSEKNRNQQNLLHNVDRAAPARGGMGLHSSKSDSVLNKKGQYAMRPNPLAMSPSK